jgi:diguanylate cyclase (GGDEF)-like protein/PAS domain S-box-containing protein
LFVIGLAMAGLAEIHAAAASHPEKTYRILYVNSYHRGYLWSDGIEQGLRERLSASGKKIDVYIEFLDTQRFPDLDHLPLLAKVFSTKHFKIHYDAVVVSDNDAFYFAVTHRARIFPDTPLIFCGYNSFRPDVLKGVTNVAGVNEEVDFRGAIDTALAVHPQTERLVFITSDYYASGRRNQERVETDILPSYRGRYKILQLKNLYLQDMEQRLAKQPPRSLVFVLGDPVDNRDERFISLPDYYRRVAAASAAPVYSFWDFALNTGVMGGRIITGPDQGRRVAEIALQVLDGLPADSIPVVMETPTSRVFDFNAMKRFGVASASLPEGSRIINRPDAFYDRYKTYGWASLVVFVILSVLVLLLAVLLRKSRVLAARLHGESEERRKAALELQRYKDQLENTVSERTAALSSTNLDLEKEITHRKQAAAALRETEAQYRSLFENMLDGFAYCKMLYDEEGSPVDFVYLDVNAAFESLTGLKDVVGKKVTEAIPGVKELNPELFEIYGRVALTGKTEIFEVEFKPLAKWLSVSVYSMRKGYFVAVFDDITERRLYEKNLEHLAITDQLTGLLNRRSLEDMLNRTLAKAKRGAVSSLLYMDLDNFKDVNDSVGHSAGDEVLITLAGLISEAVRTEDIVFRLGGDEFAVLLDGMAGRDALHAAERLRAMVEAHRFELEGRTFPLSLSIGLMEIDGALTTGELMSQADAAMYRAKAQGKNRVVAA